MFNSVLDYQGQDFTILLHLHYGAYFKPLPTPIYVSAYFHYCCIRRIAIGSMGVSSVTEANSLTYIRLGTASTKTMLNDIPYGYSTVHFCSYPEGKSRIREEDRVCLHNLSAELTISTSTSRHTPVIISRP